MGLEYYSFDKVLNELAMDEDELKRLVSEGQIRAFRDDNRMKFRKDDIEALRKGKQTDQTIDLPGDELELGDGADLHVVDSETEETLLDLDGIEVEGDFQTDESSVPSLDLDADLGDEALTEELVFDDEDDLGLGDEATQPIDADAGFDDDDLGMQTEPLSLEEDDLDDDEIEETELDDPDATFVGEPDFDDDEDVEDDDADATFVKPEPKRRTTAARRASASAKPKPTEKSEPSATHASPPIGTVWVVALLFIAIFYVIGAMTLFDYSRGTTSPIGESTGGFVSEQFFNNTRLGDPNYSPIEPTRQQDFPEFLTTTGN